jgi:hypothetical protein
MKKNGFFDQKCQISYPWASIKDVKATREALPSKVNIQLGSLLASWIRILPTKINADPDPALFVSDLQDVNKN